MDSSRPKVMQEGGAAATSEKVVIKLSKLKGMLMVIGSFMFVGGGVWLLSLDAEGIESLGRLNNPTLVKGIGIAGIGFFGLCGIYGARKLFDSKPGLVLDSSGISDNSSAVAAGHIAWKDIRGFDEVRIQGQKMLAVMVQDPEKYIAAGSPMRRATGKANLKLVGSPISISASSLEISHAELVEVCERFYRRYGGG